MIDWKMVRRWQCVCGKTHGGDGDGGAAAWRARGMASESERARNGLSMASPHSSPRQHRCMATMQCAWPVDSRPPTCAWTQPSEPMTAPDEAT